MREKNDCLGIFFHVREFGYEYAIHPVAAYREYFFLLLSLEVFIVSFFHPFVLLIPGKWNLTIDGNNNSSNKRWRP